jgi:aryl-alcohol dehydrogenase-like predicted oxidoreductase
MGERGGTRITFGTYVHGLLSEGFAPDHEFDATDWRGRSVREGSSGTSGNVFFAGGAFARNVEVARRLRVLADRQGTSLAAFVLALTLREPETDIALMGCRTAAEVVDGLEGLRVELDHATRAEVAAVLAGAERPSENLLGAPA